MLKKVVLANIFVENYLFDEWKFIKKVKEQQVKSFFVVTSYISLQFIW